MSMTLTPSRGPMVAPSPCHGLTAAVICGILFCSPVTTWQREDQGSPANKRMHVGMTRTPDPISTGVVASLAHPGGNITGLSLVAANLSAKPTRVDAGGPG